MIRLARPKYNSLDDAEGIGAPYSVEYLDKIRIYHMGFVRDRKIHNAKIINMHENIFGIPRDSRCDDDARENVGIFRPETRFSKEDLLSIPEPLPKVIQEWAKARAYGEKNPYE